jgi:hypothetical protein
MGSLTLACRAARSKKLIAFIEAREKLTKED